MIKVKRLHSAVSIPTRASAEAAGFDLRADLSHRQRLVIAPGHRELIGTGIQVELPEGTVGMIRPRSGLALRHGIDVMAGVIDADYRGELLVVLINHGQDAVTIDPNERIAQLVVQELPDNYRMIEVDEIGDTVRGDSGYGSTGRS